MNKLLSYLNSLPKEGRIKFCLACGISENHMRKAISLGQTFKPKTCVAIENASNFHITRIDLNPDDWHLIWPELRANHRHNPQPQAEAV
jgi:DNA-binding transcriptional regulator YdaS (Cro superfamily)